MDGESHKLAILEQACKVTDRIAELEAAMDGQPLKYRLRLVGYLVVLGAQTQVDWQGNRYAIDGDPRTDNGSRRTAHVDYVIVRDRYPGPVTTASQVAQWMVDQDQIEQVRIAAAMSATARRTPAPPTARPHQASYCGC